MLPAELIRRKRDGHELSAGEIAELVGGIADGTVTDAQVGALAMAIFWRGMSPAERVALTGAMTRSGDVIDWGGAGLAGPVLDKHSTGGVGDKVSLLLAPIVAACGAFVPMICGRGLGHTGGTLDKLEPFPGYDVTPDYARLREVVTGVGCAIVGQTARLA
ncbi:MAG: pyrimidine-nucleoside phosphorylase, partial [Solirubrobacterales bacterium]|nr:pyrimidine-nucleoside phosphorylase [Solirubrobacterales bacterium]